MQTVTLYLCYIQYVCSNDNFSELIRKINPTNNFFEFIYCHHKIPIQICLDGFYSNTEFRNQFIVSVIKFEESLEVYDTDSPVKEVWQLNFYYQH